VDVAVGVALGGRVSVGLGAGVGDDGTGIVAGTGVSVGKGVAVRMGVTVAAGRRVGEGAKVGR
jgi:acetyltransferase-like isoleucine patch superfamily enzyme